MGADHTGGHAEVTEHGTPPPGRMEVVAGCAAMALLVLWRGFRDFLHTDVSWYLYVAERLLDGSRLYVDLGDVNPPLIVYLSTPPVLASRLIGVGPETALRIAFLVLAILSTALAARFLVRAIPGPVLRSVTILALFFVALPLPAGLFHYNISAFAQREHAALLLLLPLLAATAHRAAGASLALPVRLACALAAGVGLSIKPHFLAAWGMVFVWSLFAGPTIRRRLLLVETAVIVVVQVIYWALVAVLHTEYLRLIPAIVSLYGSTNAPLRALLLNGTTALWAVTLAAHVAAARFGRPAIPFAGISAAAGSGFLLGAIVQSKGWWYQFYPARGLLLVSLAVVGIDLLAAAFPGLAAAFRRRATTLAAVLLALAAAFPLAQSFTGGIPGPAPALLRTLSRQGMPATLVVLSTDMHPAFPLVNLTGATWCSPFPALWFLPAFYGQGAFPADSRRLRSPAEMGPLERAYFERVTKSFVTMKPEVCIVDTSEGRWFFGQPFPFFTYYNQDPAFRSELMLYRPVASSGSFLVYRRDPPSSR